MAKKKLKTRLDLIQEHLDSQVYVVEEDGKKVADSRNPNLPLYNINKKLQSVNQDIAPIKTTTNKTTSKNSTRKTMDWRRGRDEDFGNAQISLLPDTDPNAGRYLNLLIDRADGKLLMKDTVTGQTFLSPSEEGSLLDKTSITDKILGINGTNNTGLTGNYATSTKKDVAETTTEDIAPTKTTTREGIGETNEEGYTYTGKNYGDYWYQNYSKDKDLKIYEKDGKYYVQYSNGRYQDVDTISFMTTKEADAKALKEAKELGYTASKSDLSISNQIKLDTSNLTTNEYKDYSEDLARQEEKENKEYAKKNEVHYGGAGLKGALGELKSMASDITYNVDKEIIAPIKNFDDNYETGKLNNQLALEYYKKMQGEENNADELAEQVETYNKFNQDLLEDPGAAGTAIQNLNTQVESIKNQGIAATILSTGGALIGGAITRTPQGAIAGAKIGGGIGYTFGSTPYMFKLEAGNQYKALTDMGVPDDIAKKYANVTGIANAAIEAGENIVDLFTFGTAGKATSAVSKEAVSDMIEEYGESQVKLWLKNKLGEETADTIIKGVKVAGTSYLQNIGSETIEESAQETTSIISERLATSEAGIEREATVKDDVKRILESGATAAVSTAFTAPLTSVGGAIVTNTVNNVEAKIGNQKATNKEITSSEINEIIEQEIGENKSNLTTEEIQQIQSEIYKDLQENGVTITDIEQIKRSQLYEQTEISDNEKINSWQQSFITAKSNNTTKAHHFSEFGNRIIQDKNISMRAVNYDTLVEEGKMKKETDENGNVSYLLNVNGEYKEVNVHGFKEKGVLNVNLQSNRAFETTVGHEIAEFIKSVDESMYNELSDIAIELGKADGTYTETNLNKYADVYGENTDSVKDEYVNDKIAELFDNEEFINKLNEKPNLFQKIIGEIKHLVKMATAGSSEKRKLLDLQHKLEKKFKEAYQNVDMTKDKIYSQIRNEKQIVHVGDVLGILKSGEFSGSVATQNIGTKPSRYKGYGEGIVFKPKVIEYINKNKLYKGDGGKTLLSDGTRTKENLNKYSTIEDYINEDTSKRQITKYNEGIIETDSPIPISTETVDYIWVSSSTPQEFIDEVKSMGYEVRYSTQPKATNKSIQYGLSEKGTLQDSDGNDVTLETSETGTHGTLMAIHNLSDTKLKGILELGGFPLPSIAIMNPATTDLSYGDISVLFDKQTIDPSNASNEVYGSDVYSPRFPQTIQKVNEKELSKLESYIGKSLYLEDTTLDDTVQKNRYTKEFINKFAEENNITVEDVYKDSGFNYTFSTDENVKNFVIENDITYDKLFNDVGLREEFYKLYRESNPTLIGLTERKIETFEKIFNEYDNTNNSTADRLNSDFNAIKNGQEKVLDEYATEKALRDKVLDQYEEQYTNFLNEKFSPVFGDKYIRNNKDVFTPSGNRRSFKQLYNEYTLDNVVKEMKGKVRGEEGFFYGAGNIRSQVTPQFKSIAEIKENESSLVTNSVMEAVKQEIDLNLSNLSEMAQAYGGYSYDSYETALNEIAGLKKITPAKARKILNDYGFENVPDSLIDESIEFLEELKNAPTEYFEAKPQRAVGLNEVQAIVIPNTLNAELKQQLQDAGLRYYEYDPSIEGDRQRVINQFDDLKFSLSSPDEIAPTRKSHLTYAEDVKLEQTIAPLQEEIKTLTETVNELKEQIAPIAEKNVEVAENITEVEYTQPTKVELDNIMTLMETGGTEYSNVFFGLRDKYGQRNLYKAIREYKKSPDTYEAPIKGDEFAPTPQNIVEQQGQEAFNNIDESNMPIETDDYIPDETGKMTSTESLFETRNYEDVGSRKVNAYQYDNPEVKPYFQEEAQSMLGDLKGSIKGERSYNDDLYYSSGGEQGFYGTERQTTDAIAELLDGMDGKYKYTYADIEKGLNAIINDEGAENNAISKRIEFYLDQRLREGYTTVDGIEVPANQEYLNMMAVKEMNDYYNSIPITDDMIPREYVEKPVDNVSNSEPIAPTKKLDKSTPRTTETSKPEPINKAYQLTIDGTAEKIIDNSTYKEVAEILVNEPTTESQRNKRKWAIFKANVFDKGMVFEDLSLKENNRELMGKWDYTLTSEARGQYAIGNGHNGLSKSLNDIRAEVDNTGNTKDFYNYMYHKHNVDRMTLDKRYGVENKPVFGESVTAEQSQAIVNQYEKTHPEFMDFAQDVYDYVNADKQLLVDNGVISQETADLWSKMYPHYVPTRRTTDTGIDINVPLDTRKTGINAPIKKATGGSADILPLFDTLAMRTLQTYRATAKNSFGVELMNTLGTKVESNQTNVDEVIDSIEAQEELLQDGKKGGSPTFTVFENGEKHTFEITKDMYDALKPLDESSFLSKTIKPLNVASNVRRGLLTEYNPTFLLTNAIKDTQDILINSQHVVKTYSKIPEAHKQLLTKGYWYQEYVANGGEQNSYFDNETNTFKTENKGLAKIMDLPPLSTISKLNNHIEMIPRLAEYIASRESGRSIEVSMLDAARVTTNFKAGGAATKWANRNGATFLNASVQGAMQQVRNIREAKANGVRGWVNLATKFAIAGLPAILLNNFVWEDDEEYEDLSDYVKQNYYIVGKTDDGTFIRIPKGRTVAVIQEGLNQMENLITGDDEVDLKSFIDLTINNLAPNNPLDNNIFSPIVQTATNTAWYGGDLLPTRLQDLPAAEQYDESTDMFSRWIGETFNVSPYKVNYLLDQYSGGIGDLVLPMMTPEAESDGDSLMDYFTAPLRSKFTVDSVTNNQNVSDFYDLREELTTQSKKTNATDKDLLQNKYINSVNAELNELYKQKREIQNSDLSNSEKYKQAREIQSQINDITENALSEYNNVTSTNNYAQIGDREYYKRINSEGEEEWAKINEEEAEDLNSLGFTTSEKSTYFNTKSEISSIVSDYKDNKADYEDLDEDSDEYKNALEQLSDDKKADIIDKIKNTGFSDEQKAYLYGKYYSSDKTLEKVTSSGISFDNFLTYHKESLSLEETEEKVEYLFNTDMTDEAKTVIYETSVLTGFDNEDKYKDYKAAKSAGIDINSWLSYKKQEFKADKDSSGKSISGSRKEKVISYINSLDLSIPQKAIMIRQEYSTFTRYNNDIIEYVDGLDISYEEKVYILEGLDMEVLDDGTVKWG